MSKSVSVITLGCRVNQYESQAIEERFSELGFEIKKPNEICDIYIINTCAVTVESERKSRQMIHRARKLSPDAVIGVVGCSSQLHPEKSAEAGADIVLGTSDKLRIVELTLEALETKIKEMIIDTEVSKKADCDSYCISTCKRAREFIKIEDGCDGKCAYCTIAKARGDVRCKKPEAVIEEISNLACLGCKEVTLTGIELSAYSYGLEELIRRVNGIDGIERIRLGSLEPTLLTESFRGLLSDCEKLAHHFHISLQSGCTKTLNAMRRRYNADKALENILLLKESSPDLMLSCDLIVGFPGETEDDFEVTLDFLRKAKFLHVHCFPFSKRPGTVAYSMPNQLSNAEKSSRLKIVEELQREIKNKLLDNAVSRDILSVLFEEQKDGMLYGHSDNFFEICAKVPDDVCGKIITVKPNSHNGDIIFAEIIK